MKRSNRLVLLIGVFLAIVAFVLILFTLQGGQSTQPTTTAPTTVKIVVAAKDIPLSTKIQEDDLTLKEIPTTGAPSDAFTDTSFVVGQVARSSVATGQYISTTVLSGSNGTITTIECPAQLVCMAVQVDQVSGVGTLTRTGDHVDMLIALTADRFPVVTIQPSDQSVQVVSGLNGTSAKLLLQGLQVVGTLLPPPPADTGQAPASPGTGPNTSLTGQQQIVILAVNAQQSEVIKYSQVDASISLVLRSTADFIDPVTGDPLPPETIVPVTTKGITLRSLVDDYGVLVPELVEAVLPEQTARPR